jgi:predicted transcriptional regulator
MVISLSADVEQSLKERADRLHRSVDELVKEAIAWYVRMDPDLIDELGAWQEVRDEALDIVEGSSSSNTATSSG